MSNNKPIKLPKEGSNMPSKSRNIQEKLTKIKREQRIGT